MKIITYNENKRERLLQARGIDLQIVANMIQMGEFVDIINHSSRKYQKVFVLMYEGYYCAIPYIEDEQKIFLKTAFFSRKLKKLYS